VSRRRKIGAVLALSLLSSVLSGLAVASPAAAQTSGFDPTWGVDGVVQVDADITAKTVTSDGDTTWVAGMRYAGVDGFHSRQDVLVVAAYDSRGRLIPSFGDGGTLVVDDVPRRGMLTTQLLVDGRGGLLLDYFDGYTERHTGQVFRIDASSGQLDRTWGQTGRVPYDSVAYGVEFAPDSLGRLYVGSSDGLSRYTPDGQPDPTWGPDGRRVVVTGRPARLVMVDDSDRVLVVQAGEDNKVHRFLASGEVDASFGAGGTVQLPGRANDLLAHVDGILVSTSEQGACAPSWASRLSRFDDRGLLDPSWGSAGSVRMPCGLDLRPDAHVDSQGRVLTKLTVPSTAESELVRLLPDGDVDPSFSFYSSMEALHPFQVSAIGAAPDGTAYLIDGAYYSRGVARLSVDLATHAGTGFVPVQPFRVLDTRHGLGAPQARLQGGQALRLQLGGVGSVPSDAAAVVLNVTAVGPSADSFITVWPAGAARPTVSNLNPRAGTIRPNAVTVKMGARGAVDLYNEVGTVDLVVDVAGYYVRGGGVGFTPLPAPVRLLDTRVGTGAPAGPVASTAPLAVQVVGAAGVPAGATAVVMNLTAVGPTKDTFVSVWPTGTAQPTVSSLNLSAGEIAPNLVTVKLGEGGRVSMAPGPGQVHLVADVAGWYGPDGETLFVPLQPTRLLDTREEDGPAGAGDTVPFLAEQAGVPVFANAVVVNVTAVAPSASTFVTAFPYAAARPLASNLNPVAGVTAPNLAIVSPDGDGVVGLYNDLGRTDLIADVAGYFTD
jgi:hypothetical protein